MKKFITFIIAVMISVADIVILQKNYSDKLTLAFIGVSLAVIFAEAVFCRSRLHCITRNLKMAGQNLKDLIAENGTRDITLPDDIFTNKYLHKLYSDYKNACKNRNVDITEHINETTINTYINKNISDLIPGTMTALGILGTFIGLTIGLQKFSIGKDDVELIKNITGLTDGIKIAFHTSIIGVSLSVIYGFFYNRDILCMQTELYNFYDVFDSIEPTAQDEFANKLFFYQEKQTDALLKLSDNISTGISDRMAEAIEKTINPAMENVAQKINDVIVEVKGTLDTYIQGTVESQTETMNKIVDKFMKTLNKSMDDQFKALSQSVDEMCKWQGVTTENIKEINSMMTPLVEELGKQNTLTSNNNEISISLFRKTEALVGELKKYSDESAAYIKAAHEYIEQLGNLNSETKKNFDDLTDSVRYSEEAFEKISSLMTIINKEREETQAYQENLEIRIQSMDKAVETVIQKMSDYLSGIAEVDVVYRKIVDSANDICQKISDENSEIKKEFSSEIAEINEASKKSYEKLNQFIDDLKVNQAAALKSTREGVRDIKVSLINVLKNFTNNNTPHKNEEDNNE